MKIEISEIHITMFKDSPSAVILRTNGTFRTYDNLSYYSRKRLDYVSTTHETNIDIFKDSIRIRISND